MVKINAYWSNFEINDLYQTCWWFFFWFYLLWLSWPFEPQSCWTLYRACWDLVCFACLLKSFTEIIKCLIAWWSRRTCTTPSRGFPRTWVQVWRLLWAQDQRLDHKPAAENPRKLLHTTPTASLLFLVRSRESWMMENKCFRQTSCPAQQWVGGPGVPWDSLICLPRTSTQPEKWIIGCQSQPRSQANHYHTLDCTHDMTIIIVSGYRTTQIDNHTQEMATDVRSLVQRHSF